MHENSWGWVTFLINVMLSKPYKFDGSILEGGGGLLYRVVYVYI